MIQICVTDHDHLVPSADLFYACEAIERQLNTDVRAHWATPRVELAVALNGAWQPAPHVWRVNLVTSLANGYGGVHLDEHGHPGAHVVATGKDWTVLLSHELVEMVIDPTLRLTRKGLEPILVEGEQCFSLRVVEYLVEACDPVQASTYLIGDVEVADFITPSFYLLRPRLGGVACKARGAAFTVQRGGYLTWLDPATREVSQLLWLGERPETRALGVLSEVSFRKFVEDRTKHLWRKK